MPKADRLDKHRKNWKTCLTNKYFSTSRLDKPNKTVVDTSAHHEAIKTAVEGWAEVDLTKLVFTDISGRSNNKTYRVAAPEGAEPKTVILHINKVGEDDTASAERERDAQKAGAEIFPQRLSADDSLEIVIEADGGNPVGADRTVKDFAEALASVHKVEPAWFDAAKEKIGEKLEALKEGAAGAPVWWFALHPVMLAGLSEDKLKEFMADFVEPISEAGKKVVTCHGDFHKGNVLEKEDKTLQVVGFDFMYAGFAALDIAYYLMVNSLPPPARKEFVQAYLKAMGQEEENEEETNKLIYDVEMQSLRVAFMNCWLLTENAMEKDKNYKGEIWTMIKEFETKSRSAEEGETEKAAELQKSVVDNGVWVAATNDMTPEQKKVWDKHKGHYSGEGGGCCSCNVM